MVQLTSILAKYPRMQRGLQLAERFSPAAAFLGGFLWDAITLGMVVNPSDLIILAVYYVAAIGILIVLGKGWTFRWSEFLPTALQFFFGGLFSALTVFYFKSSGSAVAYLPVLLLVGLLVGNEFLRDRYNNLTLSWLLCCLSGTMYLNFALPYVVRSVHWFWFLVSSAMALGVVFGLRRLSTVRHGVLWPSLVVSGLIILLYVLQWIPPVPMVLKQSLVCLDCRKDRGAYLCSEEDQGVLSTLGFRRDEVTHRPGKRLCYLSSVFAPTKLETTVEHRWQRWNERTGEWQGTDRMPFPMRGGRELGWRVYSYKQTVSPGRWRVGTALHDGPLLGYHEFEVVSRGSDEELPDREEIALE
ncbi:MAG: hypothetical protein A2284_13830 [Deltaproteobacteria bacterium RIFOXYA12_FULL_61_11]|nr:MAG: hypothetical protein A2284_13830 [Deltaproteobacteria bacterium RIFOXYA12_FULL_61_11]